MQRGKIHREQIAVAGNRERTAEARLKPHSVALRFENLKHDKCGSQSRVTTKLHFAARREPAQLIVMASRNEVSGLRKIVFGCDRTQQAVI